MVDANLACLLCAAAYIFVLVLLVYTAVPRTCTSACCCGNNRPYANYMTNIIFDICLALFWGAMLGLMITGYNKLEWIQRSVAELPQEGPWTEAAKGLGLSGIFKDYKAPASGSPTYSGFSSYFSSPSPSPTYSSYSSSSKPYSSDYSTYSSSPYSFNYRTYSSSPSSPSSSTKSYMTSPSHRPLSAKYRTCRMSGETNQVVAAVSAPRSSLPQSLHQLSWSCCSSSPPPWTSPCAAPCVLLQRRRLLSRRLMRRPGLYCPRGSSTARRRNSALQKTAPSQRRLRQLMMLSGTQLLMLGHIPMGVQETSLPEGF